jgi:enoyl-CoA hydratase
MVSYHCDDTIATITIDDGKVNVLSLAVLAELDAALSRAERDDAVVILAGRDGVFSAGFDLPVLRGGGPDAIAMLRAGFELAARLLAFPRPVVIACTGHAVAMGVFLLLGGDYRVGITGPYKITPADAVTAGFLDRAVEASSVHEVARGVAAQLATLDRSAHETTKRRARAQALSAIRSAIDADTAEYQVRASAS